jgi:biopolymer transport protein ExbB/TolQ
MGLFWYYATHPEAIINAVANALLYPVLITTLFLLVYSVFEFGRFTWEILPRPGRRDLAEITAAARAAAADLAAGRFGEAAQRMTDVHAGMLFKRFFTDLAATPDFGRTHLLKSLADTENWASKRLERTRLLVRVGPMLGLMGTFIPISPALVGLANGDVQALANNLLIAFSTTIIGLLIGGLGYTMSAVRDRRYTQDVNDIEYALDVMEGAR